MPANSKPSKNKIKDLSDLDKIGYSSSDASDTDMEKDLEKTPDVLSQNPIELQKVTENISYLNKIKNRMIRKDVVSVEVFGVEKWDLNTILKMNIWDRGILTVHKLATLYLRAVFEQKKKYMPHPTKKPFDYWWIIIIIIMCVGALLFLLVVLPMLGNIKLF